MDDNINRQKEASSLVFFFGETLRMEQMPISDFSVYQSF
jgi:hypothetical protein